MPSASRALFATAAAFALPFVAWAEGGAQGAAGDKDFPGIEKLMPRDEFVRAGLDQLTPEQVRVLDNWLLRYTAGEAYVVQSTSEEVRAATPEFRIEARIMPPFDGWSGKTVFRLDNGQVWRQRIKGRYLHSGDDMQVVISRNFLGYYMMTVVGTGRSIGVEPVRTKDTGPKPE